jgi:hypothetical protein
MTSPVAIPTQGEVAANGHTPHRRLLTKFRFLGTPNL